MKIGLYLDPVAMQILKNGVFVSCEPKDRIEKLSPGLIDERLAEVGHTYLVCNMQKEQVGKAKLVDAFSTTFGNPDERLLKLIGFEGQLERFHSQYAGLYKQQFPDEDLIEETELFVTVYEPQSDS